jgi:hypothetical protein
MTSLQKSGVWTMTTLLKLSLWQQVLLALALGVLAGAWLGPDAVVLKPLGTLFLNAIKMLVVPLVFFALVQGITALGSGQKLGRLAAKTVGLFLLTAMIASGLGLLVGSLFQFEANPALAHTTVIAKEIPPVAQVLTDLIPTNIISAFASGNVLQIIVFAVLFAIAINAAADKAEPLKKVINAGAEVMFELTRLVLKLTPIGVFGLIAWVVGQYGLATLLPLGKFILAIYLACLLHMLLTYGALVKLFTRMPVWQFFRTIFPIQLVAFSTASSYGTLPVSYKVVTEDLKVSKEYASFVLPLGSTINMDGCGGIYPAIAAIFIANLYGIPLQLTDYLLIAGTATVASLGTAGVPGTALVMLTVTLSVVGLPLEGIAFIAAIDRVVDMIRTTTNVTGDATVALVVATQEQLLVSDPQSINAADIAALQAQSADSCDISKGSSQAA